MNRKLVSGFIYVLDYCIYLLEKFLMYLFSFTLEAIMSSNYRVLKFLDYLVDNYISNDADILSHLWTDHSENLSRIANAC